MNPFTDFALFTSSEELDMRVFISSGSQAFKFVFIPDPSKVTYTLIAIEEVSSMNGVAIDSASMNGHRSYGTLPYASVNVITHDLVLSRSEITEYAMNFNVYLNEFRYYLDCASRNVPYNTPHRAIICAKVSDPTRNQYGDFLQCFTLALQRTNKSLKDLPAFKNLASLYKQAQITDAIRDSYPPLWNRTLKPREVSYEDFNISF